jgi:hypothetical protein
VKKWSRHQNDRGVLGFTVLPFAAFMGFQSQVETRIRSIAQS